MNHTHFVLINEDMNPFAVIKRSRFPKDLKESLVDAIRHEYDAEPLEMPEVDFETISPDGTDIQVVLDNNDQYTENITIKPIWEY